MSELSQNKRKLKNFASEGAPALLLDRESVVRSWACSLLLLFFGEGANMALEEGFSKASTYLAVPAAG